MNQISGIVKKTPNLRRNLEMHLSMEHGLRGLRAGGNSQTGCSFCYQITRAYSSGSLRKRHHLTPASSWTRWQGYFLDSQRRPSASTPSAVSSNPRKSQRANACPSWPQVATLRLSSFSRQNRPSSCLLQGCKSSLMRHTNRSRCRHLLLITEKWCWDLCGLMLTRTPMGSSTEKRSEHSLKK